MTIAPSPKDALSTVAARALRTVGPQRLAEARTVLHVSFGAEAEFHVRMWVPFVSAVDPTYVVVVRSTGLFIRLRRRAPEIPVVLLRTGREVGDFVGGAPNLRVVLYTANSGNVLDFVRHEELRHVFIGHGDSDKVASINRFFRLYDEIWVAGQAQVDRLRGSGNIGPGQLLQQVGRPVVRSLLAAPDAASAGDLPVGVMPTWEGPYDGQNYTSAALLADIVHAAADASARPVVVKVHPWTGRRDRTLAKAEQRASLELADIDVDVTFIPRERPADAVMRETAALVADVSSVAVDYLLTGRPLFVYLPPHLADRIRSGTVPLTDYAYTFASPADLHRQLQAVLGGDDPLASQRAAARDYLVDVDAMAGNRFEALLDGLLARPRT